MNLNLNLGLIGTQNVYSLYLLINVLLGFVYQAQSQFKFKCTLVLKPKDCKLF